MAKILPEALKERIRSLPERPGVYLFKDRDGRVIYIGKALSIRKRVMGHFRYYGEAFSKEGAMLERTASVDLIETPDEAEALLLEASLVRQSQPKYNSELRDDKSYPFLKITGEEYPRLLVVRGRKADGGKYFGPYTDAGLLKKAVKMLRAQFPIRTCRVLPKKVCLMYHIGQCGGPCEGKQSREAYMATVKELERFLEGRRDALVRHLTRRMKEHSSKREYEAAQVLYQQVHALRTLPSAPPREHAPALDLLRKGLELPREPRRIECFDISNIQGREAVGSMVVFVAGAPERSEYRRFRVRTVSGIDDYLMMREVVRRRYARVREEKAPLPDLVVIDGGKGHLAAAKKELDALGLEDLPILSIAKEHEHLFKPGHEAPFIFPLSSPVLHLLRHIRDEAHRFAITYHRRLHKKAAFNSALDSVPGVGPATRAKLLARVGSVRRIASLGEEELARRAGITPALARRVLAAVRPAR